MIPIRDFERQYAERCQMTWAALRRLGRVTRPCRCDYDGCEGWQMLSRRNAWRDEPLYRWGRVYQFRDALTFLMALFIR